MLDQIGIFFHCYIAFYYGLDKSILSCLWEAEKGKMVLQEYVDLPFLAVREGFISAEDTPRAYLFGIGFLLCACA